MAALSLLLALALGDELPDRLRLDEPKQDFERERYQPRPEAQRTPMEWLLYNSRLDTGMLWTDFDRDLELETDLAGYVRWDVSLARPFSVNVTYRHYDFESSEVDGKEDEHVLIRGVFVGVGAHVPFATSFFLAGNASLGLMRWETGLHQFKDDTGPVLAFEGALGVRLTEMLRFKAGLGVDFASTDFKTDDTETQVNVGWMLGFEIGF